MNIEPAVLKEWLGDCDIKVVVYLREQVENLASSYQQEVKQLSQYCDFESYVKKYRHPNILSYNYFLLKWETAFGKENMVVRVYDKNTLLGKNIVTDFLSILGIDGSALFLSKLHRDANPSIKGALLEVKRIINGMGLDSRSLFQATYQPLLDLALANEAYRGLIGADPHFVDEIRESVSDYNRKIAQQYFGRDELFRLKPFPVDRKPNAEEIKQAFKELVGLVRQQNPAIAEQIESRLGQLTEKNKSYA